MAMCLTFRAVVPTSVVTLCVGDQLQRPFQRFANLRVVRHAIRLSQNERGQAVVVEIALSVRDIQQPGRLGISDDIFQGPIDGVAVFSTARHMTCGKKSECSQADESQIVRVPVPLRPLRFCEPGQATFQGLFAFRIDFPFGLRQAEPDRMVQSVGTISSVRIQRAKRGIRHIDLSQWSFAGELESVPVVTGCVSFGVV